MHKGTSRMGKTAGLTLVSAMTAALLFPQAVQADINSLKNQQQQKQQELDQARQQEKDAKEKKDQFQQQINVTAAQINQLADQINAKEDAIAKLQTSIFQKTQEIAQTQVELDAATQRVQSRDALLKQRLRMMYEQGEVQYLDVLLSATSFSDFLDRFDALSIIFKQDTEILRKNKQDRDTVAQKKQQMEDQKSQMNALRSQQLDEKVALDGMMAKKEEINRQLQANRDEQVRIEHEAQKIEDNAVSQLYNLSQQIDQERYKQNTATASSGNTKFSGPFTWPCPSSYTITDEFGDRIDPFTGERMGHNGMDIGAPQGTPVVAAQDGKVITAGWVEGFGNCIIIDHGGGLWSLYGHLVNGGILVSMGQEVHKGDHIGNVGSTGRSTGPHLHFGVYENGQVVNPRKYL